MFGAITGDIAGSRFEFRNYRKKDFEIFNEKCFFTDDSVMTIAVAKAISESEPGYTDLAEKCVYYMHEIGRRYPDCGYGGRFYRWMFSGNTEPYYSFGNGSAMRVSPCGFAASSLEEAERLAVITAGVTHNHPEGIKGAKAAAAAIYLARSGASKAEIKQYINDNYYNIDFTIDSIRNTYKFNETCQGTVPQAIEAFLESSDFEDAIRTAVSVGGDSDTLAAITGGIAEAFYGIPDDMKNKAKTYLDDYLLDILDSVSIY